MSEHKRSASQPITRHPLFPAIVALWAGALLALASLAVPPALIERAVQLLGIDRVLPMAAPPLGTTARILIALSMTGLGGVIGWIGARRLAAPAPARPEPRRYGAPARSAPAEAASPSVERSPAMRPRTRAAEPAAEARETPGTPAGILNLADFDLEGFEDRAPAPAAPADDRAEPAASPLNNSLFAAYSRDLPGHAATALPEREPASGETPETVTADAGTAQAETPQAETPQAEPAQAEAGEAEAREAESPELAAPARPRAAERIASAPLDELSPIELLERLALAMAHRRERNRAATLAVLPAAVTDTTPEDAAPANDTAGDTAPFPAPSPAPFPEQSPAMPVPAALRPVGIDAADEDGDDALPGYIPPRHIGSAPQDQGALRPGYSSLLDLSRPRPAPEPAPAAALDHRRFDAPAQDDPEETERALRTALDTLQRMSGAA